MLTRHEWTTLGILFKYFCKSQFFSFDWDENNNLLRPTCSKIKQVTPYLCICTAIFYVAFDVWRLQAVRQDAVINMADLVMHLLCIMWYSLVAIFASVVNLQCRDEFPAIVNQQVAFNFAQGMISTNSQFDEPKKRAVAFRYISPSWLISIIFVWTSVTVSQRNKKFFIFSALPEEWKTTRVLISITCVEFLYCVSFSFLAILLISIAYVYLVSSSFWLRRLCVDWPKHQLTVGLTRGARMDNVETALRIYRCLELLNRLYNFCFASIIIPEMKLFTILAGSVSAYAVIKHRSSMHPLMEVMIQVIAITQLGILVFMCLAGAKFHDNTKRFHRNYEYVIMRLPSKHQKYFKRAFAACPTFGFRVGNVDVIKKITIASALYVLFNSIMFLLLTY